MGFGARFALCLRSNSHFNNSISFFSFFCSQSLTLYESDPQYQNHLQKVQKLEILLNHGRTIIAKKVPQIPSHQNCILFYLWTPRARLQTSLFGHPLMALFRLENAWQSHWLLLFHVKRGFYPFHAFRQMLALNPGGFSTLQENPHCVCRRCRFWYSTRYCHLRKGCSGGSDVEGPQQGFWVDEIHGKGWNGTFCISTHKVY